MVTNSIVTPDEEYFEIISGIIERVEKEYDLRDTALLGDYLNIIFDCSRESAEAFMSLLQKEQPEVPWRLMMSEGEKVMSVYIYDGQSLTVEDIGKTMDEIALDAQFSCSGNCSECTSGGCGHEHNHGEGCDCGECRAQEFSLDETIGMFTEMMREGDDGFFGVLANAFREELRSFTEEQSGDDADEAYDVFMNNIAQIILACAGSDGSYTETEHALIEDIFGQMDFKRMKGFVQMMTKDDDDTMRTMKFWHEAETYGCEIRRYILMLCTYVCCADGEINEKEHDFLEMLVSA